MIEEERKEEMTEKHDQMEKQTMTMKGRVVTLKLNF